MIFELKTGFSYPGGARQIDLLTVMKAADGPAVAGIEGKVQGTLGEPTEVWLSKLGEVKRESLARLCANLEFARQRALLLGCQLLHRADERPD